MRGSAARALVPALVVLGLLAVVAIAATGSTSRGTGRTRPPVYELFLDTFISLGIVLPLPECNRYLRDAMILGFIAKVAANLYRDNQLNLLEPFGGRTCSRPALDFATITVKSQVAPKRPQPNVTGYHLRS